MANPEQLRQRQAQLDRFKAAAKEYGLEGRRRQLLGLPEGPAPGELIPDSNDLYDLCRQIRKVARRADAHMRGSKKRARAMQEVVGLTAWLVYTERVLALDALERSSLTVSRLAALAEVQWDGSTRAGQKNC
jgi:hypothetical protein